MEVLKKSIENEIKRKMIHKRNYNKAYDNTIKILVDLIVQFNMVQSKSNENGTLDEVLTNYKNDIMEYSDSLRLEVGDIRNLMGNHTIQLRYNKEQKIGGDYDGASK